MPHPTTAVFHTLNTPAPTHLLTQAVEVHSLNPISRLVSTQRALTQHLVDTNAPAGRYRFTVDGTASDIQWNGAYAVDCDCPRGALVDCGLFLCPGRRGSLAAAVTDRLDEMGEHDCNEDRVKGLRAELDAILAGGGNLTGFAAELGVNV